MLKPLELNYVLDSLAVCVDLINRREPALTNGEANLQRLLRQSMQEASAQLTASDQIEEPA